MDGERLTGLYRTYGPYIYARCVRLLGDRMAAEDATQETFMRVLRHLEKAPSSAEALAWIYRIATNYCLNEIRNRRRRPEPQLEVEALAAEDRSALFSDRDLIERIVRRSPVKLRVAAWLHHVDGFGQDEVAGVLGVSRRTVATRLRDFAAHARRIAARELS